MSTPTEHGISGIFLPSGEVIEISRVRSFNYNAAINALRFSCTITRYTPVGVDQLTGRVNGVQPSEGRCVVIAHRHFRHNDNLYIQDADVKVIQA